MGEFLDAARMIGERLCQDAYWHDDMCTWVGRSAADSDPINEPSVRAVGGDVYSGTAGIALFLTSLPINSIFEKTARGALSYAFRNVSATPARCPFGLFDGQFGVAYAAVALGKAFDDDLLTEEGLRLAETAVARADDYVLDLLSGSSGVVLGLLAMNEMSDDSRLLDHAMAFGDALIDRARWFHDRCSWHGVSFPHSPVRMLVSMSHGSTGIATALSELYVRTAKDEYRKAAYGVIRYEDAWFDAIAQNWPDLRASPDYRSGDGAPPEYEDSKEVGRTFMSTWCHGRLGVALGRSRMCQVFPELAEGVAALTIPILSQLDMYDGDVSLDASLCHGLAGITEVILALAEESKIHFDRSAAIARLHATWRRKLSMFTDLRFPSGLPSRIQVPGLMLGDAGVGQVLLRLEGERRGHSVFLPGAWHAGTDLTHPRL
jgi:lantibiotic modifying enzyme